MKTVLNVTLNFINKFQLVGQQKIYYSMEYNYRKNVSTKIVSRRHSGVQMALDAGKVCQRLSWSF